MKKPKPIPFTLTPAGWLKANAARTPGRFVETPEGLLYVPPPPPEGRAP